MKSVWAARKKLDGRCDVRELVETLAKRNFSGRHPQDRGAILRVYPVLTDYAEDNWQAETVRCWLQSEKAAPSIKFIRW